MGAGTDSTGRPWKSAATAQADTRYESTGPLWNSATTAQADASNDSTRPPWKAATAAQADTVPSAREQVAAVGSAPWRSATSSTAQAPPAEDEWASGPSPWSLREQRRAQAQEQGASADSAVPEVAGSGCDGAPRKRWRRAAPEVANPITENGCGGAPPQVPPVSASVQPRCGGTPSQIPPASSSVQSDGDVKQGSPIVDEDPSAPTDPLQRLLWQQAKDAERRASAGEDTAPAVDLDKVLGSPPPDADAAAKDDDAATEATEPTEDSDYDPFAGDANENGNATSEAPPGPEIAQEVTQGGADVIPDLDDDEEDDPCNFGDFMDLLRAANKEKEAPIDESVLPEAAEPKVPSSSPAAQWFAAGQPTRTTAKSGGSGGAPAFVIEGPKPVNAGDKQKKKKKGNVDYQFNPRTQRWEPVEKPPEPQQTAPPPPRRGLPTDPRAAQQPGLHAGQQRDPRRRPGNELAEIEAQAREDVKNGLCEHSQALAVRLTLRFESRPAEILGYMAKVGLPAAKDQRSTVKAIMRLCHPDKCKHPEAKKAMQVLGPLLTS